MNCVIRVFSLSNTFKQLTVATHLVPSSLVAGTPPPVSLHSPLPHSTRAAYSRRCLRMRGDIAPTPARRAAGCPSPACLT